MAIITINKKQFEKEIGKLSEEMKNKIAMFGTPIEEITDAEIQLEIFPNRPDLLSYHGFKRSFLSFLDKKPGLRKYKVNKPGKNYTVIIDSSVKNIRPYTACAIVKRLRLNPESIKEIMEIQEKLHITLGRKRKKLAIGIYPLEKIELPITLKALEPDKIRFLPLDGDREMSAFEILQRHTTGKEYAHLLARKEKFPVFIDGNENILSMPPIINSQLAGKVTEKTKNIFVECSGFDFETLKKCLNIIVTNLADMGGSIYQMNLKFSGRKKEVTPNLEPAEMGLNLQNTNKLLGVDISKKQLKKLIERMGYDYGKSSTVFVPAWRTDILHEVDLIEDVAIAYGYDNFVPEIPGISGIGEEEPREILKRKFSEILTGVGMLEVSNYHLTSSRDQFARMGTSKKGEKDFIEVEETKTDYKILRRNLSHFLLKIFSENTDSEYPQRIFETGKIFYSGNKIEEEETLVAAISPGNFTEIRQILEYFFRMTNVQVKFMESDEFSQHFIVGRVAEIIFDGKSIGFIGEIHPKILRNWKIKMPVALFEISLEEIFKKFE